MKISTQLNLNHFEFLGYADSQKRARRSVGGSEVSITAYPFMASIRYAGDAICGGSIISPNVILTAAHCIREDYFLDLLSVKVGDSDINFGGSWHRVARVLKHEESQKLSKERRIMTDIALLKLEEPINIDNKTTRTIQLLKGSDNARNYKSGILIGWGLYPMILNKTVPDPNGNGTIIQKQKITRPPANFRSVHLDIASDQTCYELAPGENLDSLFCTHTLGRLPCRGDSGSPLVVNGKQGGLLSWTFGDCSADANTAYFTDVARLSKWIDEKIKIV
ncbi:hypothetical protein QAD02_011491 [Eretmocerus hayati]|uniref:Uncharacterized protein n=1 Tax=Eretmocerus hayati TaxID=131215 RepID=A0ACC2P1Q1_9HYME|nr:hypothetical protein QAD02_011491 [Eretmocerus hayati]